MPSREMHQSVHERITTSNELSVSSSDCPAPTSKRTFATPDSFARARAIAMSGGSGSMPTTDRANGATPSARRPSPQPRSSTRLPRTSAGPPHSRSSSSAFGRRADESAGTRLPKSPTGSAVLLTLARQHSPAPTDHRREAIRIEQRLPDVVGRLGSGVPPHHFQIRAEELVEHRVLGARVAARVPPEPIRSLGDHQRLAHALRHVTKRAPLLLREPSRPLERAPRARVRRLADPHLEVRVDPRSGVQLRKVDRRG